MRSRRIAVRYRKERSLLSDVLPYEVPLTFTNRHFYDFLRQHRIEYSGGTISWVECSGALDVIVRLLFALPDNSGRVNRETRQIGNKPIPFKAYQVYRNTPAPAPAKGLIPFGYKIDHKENDFRQLSIPHPRSQVEMVDFYNSCKETILYFSSVSPFSIRRPAKVARFTYHKDRTHYERLAEDDDGTPVEQQDREYEHLRSFFVYRHYSNVYKFYESPRYHRCEKSYNALLKLDISKCFDSIYTHSIAWALLGKDAVKENLPASMDTFAGRFDALMQRMNYNETHGIIIGPEFSRVFAELLMQAIDVRVKEVLEQEPYNLAYGRDYEVFRYVDDYFIFFNDPRHRQWIEEILHHSLRDYGLYLNSAKAVLYEKPIITEISRAKRRIAHLLETSIVYELEKEACDGDDVATIVKGSIRIDSKALIIHFKTVLKECGVTYKDILNYSLAVVERRCHDALRRYAKATKQHRSQRAIADALTALLEFVFFIYSVWPRVNTTIKLCRILRMVCMFLNGNNVTHEHKHAVFKYIFDDIRLILRKNRNDRYTQVETLYLLVALSELGKEYWLEESVLASYLNIEEVRGGVGYADCSSLNYFSLTVALFYMRQKKRYASLRACIERGILKKFRERSATARNDAEMTLLLFDTLSCPYVSKATKNTVLSWYGVVDPALQQEIVEFKRGDGSLQQWFTTWRRFDFGRELDRKKGFEVY